jgi:acyl homoserine lactone synthase
MIRYIYGDSLHLHPDLAASMFRDRAEQFRTRLKWDVSVDANGYETDQYDPLNPLYVIWQRPDGRHGGSMRFLPTVGRTMVNEHFGHLAGGGSIVSPLIWECTRFCISPEVEDGGRIAALLMAAGAELGQGFYLSHAVGVFDARMVRIYRSLGWSPEIVGTDGAGRDAISVGLWEFSDAVANRLCQRGGISRDVSRAWFERAFSVAARPLAEPRALEVA